jgi:glutamyl-tRNA synthetase
MSDKDEKIDSPSPVPPVRTRYAPSPTGRTHLGNLRTALFSWSLARHTGGQFVLRIEDTDRDRLAQGAQEELLDSLRWLGLDWDEGPDMGGPHGPYVQSEKRIRYAEVAQHLIDAGRAYYCDCTPERLEIVRKTQQSRGQKPRYDNHCRSRGLKHGANTVIRFKLPETGVTTVQDALRGPIQFENQDQGDPIIVKSDGFPTYHLAAMVDDHDMHISHVLRGDEWLSSTPVHANLYAALGWTPPVFVHLPLVTDFAGHKIKKRTEPGDNTSEDYLEYAELLRVSTLRERGYLPVAVFNFLVFLGWNPGTIEEVMTPDEITARFSLDRISTSPGVFDVDRLNWFNQQHIKRLLPGDLVMQTLPYLHAAYGDHALLADPHKITILIAAVRDELVVFSDIVQSTRFAFVDPETYAPEALAELHKPETVSVLPALRAALPESGAITLEHASELFKNLRTQLKAAYRLDGKQVMLPTRAALTGLIEGPHLIDIVALLGPETCRRRIDRTLEMLVSGQ